MAVAHMTCYQHLISKISMVHACCQKQTQWEANANPFFFSIEKEPTWQRLLPAHLCWAPPLSRCLCWDPALSVSRPGAPCVGPRCSLCRGPRSRRSLSGPGALCVGVGPRRSARRSLALSVSGRGGLSVGPRSGWVAVGGARIRSEPGARNPDHGTEWVARGFGAGGWWISWGRQPSGVGGLQGGWV